MSEMEQRTFKVVYPLLPREPDDDDLYDDDGILFRAFLVGGIPICATRPLPFRIRQDKLR